MTLELYDSVQWDRDGGTENGIVIGVHEKVAEILTGHGIVTCYRENLTVTMRAAEWEVEALRNHLRVAYGDVDIFNSQ